MCVCVDGCGVVCGVWCVWCVCGVCVVCVCGVWCVCGCVCGVGGYLQCSLVVEVESRKHEESASNRVDTKSGHNQQRVPLLEVHSA